MKTTDEEREALMDHLSQMDPDDMTRELLSIYRHALGRRASKIPSRVAHDLNRALYPDGPEDYPFGGVGAETDGVSVSMAISVIPLWDDNDPGDLSIEEVSRKKLLKVCEFYAGASQRLGGPSLGPTEGMVDAVHTVRRVAELLRKEVSDPSCIRTGPSIRETSPSSSTFGRVMGILTKAIMEQGTVVDPNRLHEAALTVPQDAHG